MSVRWLVFISSLTIMLVGGINEAAACSCNETGPPCQDYFASDVVFIGTVRSVAPNPDGDYLAGVRVEFDNSVSYRGSEGHSVTVFTADGPASCGYQFQPGQRYVVYARRSKTTTQILTSICSRTRPLGQAEEDVKFFGTFTAPSAGARVFGTVHHWDRDPVTGDSRDAGPLRDVVLTLSSSDRSFQTRTGSDGRYEFAAVPSGRYLLIGSPPPLFSAASLKAIVELSDTRDCHEADFRIAYDSRVTGSILDAEGRPVANALIELTPVNKIGDRYYVPPAMDTTDQTGNFELTEVPPDRYILGVNLRLGGDIEIVTPTRFHPDASEPADAISFDVRAGEWVKLDPMSLPASRAYVVTGRITFQDGKPAAGVEVSLEDGHQQWKRVAAEVQTGEDGTFSFVVNEGIAYVANARYENPLVPGRTAAAASMPFVASEKKVRQLELVLSPRR